MKALLSSYSVSLVFFIFHKKLSLSIILIGNSADNLRQGMKGPAGYEEGAGSPWLPAPMGRHGSLEQGEGPGGAERGASIVIDPMSAQETGLLAGAQPQLEGIPVITKLGI